MAITKQLCAMQQRISRSPRVMLHHPADAGLPFAECTMGQRCHLYFVARRVHHDYVLDPGVEQHLQLPHEHWPVCDAQRRLWPSASQRPDAPPAPGRQNHSFTDAAHGSRFPSASHSLLSADGQEERASDRLKLYSKGGFVQSIQDSASQYLDASEVDTFVRRLTPVHARLAAGNRPDNWRLHTHPTPCSIAFPEGVAMATFIVRHHLRSAFEIGTGFGYSTVWIAMAMETCRGHVTTVDNYMEEKIGHRASSKQVHPDAECRRFALEALDLCGVRSIVTLHADVWPSARPLLPGSVDFLFIDGHHYGTAPTDDFIACAPALHMPGCAVFFHDSSGPEVRAAIHAANEMLGRGGALVRNIRFPTSCFLHCVTTLG